MSSKKKSICAYLKVIGQPEKLPGCTNVFYGLKQSACEGYTCVSALRREIGFVIFHFDPCVFIHKSESTFISVYVDDITIIGVPSSPFIKEIKQQLN